MVAKQSTTLSWVVILLAVVSLIPLLGGCIVMMGTGNAGGMMSGQMGGMSGGTMAWSLVWMVIVAGLLLALIMVLARTVNLREWRLTK